MRSFVPAIYDMTVAISKDESPPTMFRMFMGKSSVVRPQYLFLTAYLGNVFV